MKLCLILASIFGLLAVVLGAFGAHALEGKLGPRAAQTWETAVRYQMFHALALLALAGLAEKNLPGFTLAVIGFALGILLFSGSLYLLSLGIGPRRLLGPITPLGGLCFIAGWFTLLVGTFQR